jgi:hypothetical protein
MVPTRLRLLAAGLALLLVAWSPARGDQMFSDGRSGRVSIATYPNSDFFGNALQVGQARITFDGQWMASGAQPESLDTVAFNTDLKLTASQIAVPQGWTLAPNAVVPGFGRFSWVAHTQNPQLNEIIVPITIGGLGNNAAASHFFQSSVVTGIPSALPAYYAFHDAVIDYYEGPNNPWLSVPQGPDTGWYTVDPRPPAVTSSPEPSALILCSVGLAGLVGRRVLRRPRSRGTADCGSGSLQRCAGELPMAT